MSVLILDFDGIPAILSYRQWRRSHGLEPVQNGCDKPMSFR